MGELVVHEVRSQSEGIWNIGETVRSALAKTCAKTPIEATMAIRYSSRS
jgi:hypothetical protein